MKKRYLFYSIIAAVTLVGATAVLFLTPTCTDESKEEVIVEKRLLFGLPIDDFNISEGTVESGSTLSTILSNYGITPAQVDQLTKASQSVYDLKQIRAGHPYTMFLSPEEHAKLQYMVYEQDVTNYVVFSFVNDSISVKTDQKPITTIRSMDSAMISGSLWKTMVDNNIEPKLAMDLSEIFSWTIDFFALQEGDMFNVIYDRKFVDTVSIGSGKILGAWFEHNGKRYYAIPYEQDGKLSYWDEKGNSLRKNILKAPLKFSRISSKFSNGRMHPILRIRRPHHGVDYAAPSGTPVHAVADGTITMKGYGGGGGNTLKIQHSQGLMSGYLHLKGYAKGISKGKRVHQGDVIGYVGSTGLSTGPHLDYRIWKNGKAIDPLKIPSTPTEPIKKGELSQFNIIKERVMAALEGTLPADSLSIEKPALTIVPEMIGLDTKLSSIPAISDGKSIKK